MENTAVILYIHGMGGGGDSRIPSIMKEHINSSIPEGCPVERIEVVVRTYDFDPEISRAQIESWVSELKPDLIIGESLGSLNALRVKGLPHLFVSPSLNAPLYLGYLSFFSLVPGVRLLLNRIYRPREGDRQKLDFRFRTMYHYIALHKEALSRKPEEGSEELYFAFFGTRDHYRRSGIVSIRTWKRHFGEGSWQVYDGTHFMEEEYVLSMLIPKAVGVIVSRKLQGSRP